MTRNEILKAAKPIIFDTEAIKAILRGRKIITRRPVKTKKFDVNSYDFENMEIDPCETRIDRNGYEYPYSLNGLYATFSDGEYFPMVKAPYNIGDFLYVRETWSYEQNNECIGVTIGECPYKSCEEADGACFKSHYIYKASDNLSVGEKWHSSIHMPKEAARIFLRVTKVKVDKLQCITREDALREGASPACAIMDFKTIWNRTIKKVDLPYYGWNANPWVWVITFEKVEEDGEQECINQ